MRMDNELVIDLNGDGQDDKIQIAYVDQEGSQYIADFEVIITGSDNTFTINEYDASFEKLELFDFNQDGVNELIIMFDTHGGGGQ